MAIFASSDGNGNVTIYGASAVSDGQGHVTLLADEFEEGEVIAEDEVSLSLVDTSGYASKSELKQTADSITATVSSMRIGGRNYYRPSQVVDLGVAETAVPSLTSTGTCIGFYVPTTAGEVWSLSRSEATNNRFDYAFSVDEPASGVSIQGWDNTHRDKLKIEGITVPEGCNYLFLYLSNQSDDMPDVKLEKGDKATDWTPAIEDAEDYATEIKSQIQQLADKISMLVVDENGKTLMEQDSEGWTFNMADVASGLNAAAADAAAAAEELEKLAAYIRIKTEDGAPLLELGDESAFKTQVTNEELRFMHGEEKMAYMNNEALHIERAVIEDKLNIGGFSWYESDDGGLAIVWEGSDE